MRLKFKLFLFLVTIQLGCAGVPLFARPNCPAKASRNAPTEIRGHGDGVPQFWRKFGDPLLNRLSRRQFRPVRMPRSSLSESDKPGRCIGAMN
jgi:hypothetical protein